MAERNYSFDVIRIMAMVLIVFMHTPIPGVGTPGVVLSTLSYLTAPGIGLFLMISGALLLENKLSQSDFLKRRFSKVLWPTLFWTVVYLIVSYIKEPIGSKELLRMICNIPFEKQGHGVLWFMYTLAGLYLLTPILSQWLKKATKREVEFYLLLWAITLLYPYLKLVFTVNTEPTGILYYFTGYSGYFLLGYYLKHYVIVHRIGTRKIVACFVSIMMCVLLVFAAKMFKPDVKISELFWYLSFPVAVMATSYFILLSKVKVPHCSRKVIVKLSALSFGVYLCHILVMRTGLWNIDVIHNCGALMHIPVVAVLTCVLSWCLSYIISKLPFSKYIIGV